jgi:hypothetical protein
MEKVENIFDFSVLMGDVTGRDYARVWLHNRLSLSSGKRNLEGIIEF